MKQKGVDIASQMQSVRQAGPDLARMTSQTSTSADQTLNVIAAIEKTLQQKRSQVEEIRARQKALAREFRQLNQSLDVATKDLAQQFTGIIKGLQTDTVAAKVTVNPAPAAGETGMKEPSGAAMGSAQTAAKAPEHTVSETNEAGAEPPANTTAEKSEENAKAPADVDPAKQETGAKKTADNAPESGQTLELDKEISDLPPVPGFLGDRETPSNKKEAGTSQDSGSSARAWWKHAKKG